jgi:peptidoglycan/LPS O-acetylase OafA/YrhL
VNRSEVSQDAGPPSDLRAGAGIVGKPKGAIDPGLSIYFDLTRVVAAAVVLLSHYGPSLFGTSDTLFPGHDAVIVFFVLSGYVIALVSDTKMSQRAITR